MKAHVMFLSALAGTAGIACADTIIDNGQFGANIGSVGGQFGSDVYGQSFIAPADNVIVQFGMWLIGGDGGAPLVSIDLWADDGANHPDETNVLVSGTQHQGVLGALTRVDTFTNLALTPGQRYWIVINGLHDQTSQGSYSSTWDSGANTVPDGNMDWSNDLGLSWSGGIPNGDWGVYARLVPAPGAAGLLALSGIAALRRRR
ncbi:MAG TPA: hypothetical protein VEB59_02820 [Gemmatimonadales bacterium]|nr:hypothetical protein [Gemmatimonadales bacterium]